MRASQRSCAPSTSGGSCERLDALGLRYLGRSDRRVPAAPARDPRPAAGLYVRGGAPLDLLARPAVAVVGARACSSYGRSRRPAAREGTGGGGARRRQRARPRRRRRGASRRAGRGWRDRRGARLRDRPRLPGRACRARGQDRRRGRPDRRRVRARRRAGAVALPGAEPDRGRTLRRQRRGRGAGAKRGADHSRFRARRGAGGLRRPRRDHVVRCRRARTRSSAWARARSWPSRTCWSRSGSNRRHLRGPS